MTDVVTPAPTLAEETPKSRQTGAATARNRTALGLALAVLSGVLAGLSFEDVHIGLFIWIAFVPAIVAQHVYLPRRISGLGPAIAIGIMFQMYLGPGLAEGHVAWYLMIYGFWIALFVFGMTARSRSFHERTSYRWFLLTAPLAWVAFDFVRTTLTEVFAGTWGMVGYAMYDRPVFLQPVKIFGIHGLNLLILLVNWAIAGLVVRRLRGESSPISSRQAKRFAAVTAVLVVAWGASSWAMMGTKPATVTVGAIQPGTVVKGAPDRTPAEEFARDQAMTREVAAQGPQLVIWREAGLKFDPRTGPDGAKISALAKELHVYIAAGWSAKIGSRHYNEVATFGPDGTMMGSYGKSHPGTFAGDYSDNRGHYLVYTAPFGRFGSIICFDLDFTDSARTVARDGAQLIAVSSSDLPSISEKHYTHLVFRAIETGLSAVKADKSYDSAAIDPYGRIIRRVVAHYGAQATLVVKVPLGGGSQTPYVRFGDWLGWAAGGAWVLIIVGARLRRRAVPATTS